MPRDMPDAEGIAGAILGHLHDHPDAADTADGICEWWLRQRGVNRSLDEVQTVLDDLVERGNVERVDRPGMPPVYRRARRGDRGTTTR
jgi:hypothetical protein